MDSNFTNSTKSTNAYLVATRLSAIPQVELIVDMDQRNYTCRALE
jgi:hypothetical protein